MTTLYAIFGWPVAHSRSPAMHNAAFQALHQDALYIPLAVPPDKLEAAVQSARALSIAGFNVTLPHKTAIIPLLDDVEPAARAIGAVNTVVNRDGRLLGSNTDAPGLARALEEAQVTLRGASVLVLGAGGAARAAVMGLSGAGAAHITIAARREQEAVNLSASLRAHCAGTSLHAIGMDDAALTQACAKASLLIQATSATLDAHGKAATDFANALPLQALPPTAVVCDLVYKPLQTAVLNRAQTLHLRTVDGLGMLLYQGALAFEHWTAQPAPIAIMRNALVAI